jgi:hypothetical protein
MPDKILRKLKRHWYLLSISQSIADHYNRLAKMDSTLYDEERTEEIVSEFRESLDEPAEEES